MDLELRPGELVAFTGPSGAGKSSLAIDTLYAEGQRRFVESFSPYARQFLERLDRPPADSVEPVAAAVAVDRRAPIKSTRSTVATMAELEPYLAALYAREATPTCPECGVTAEHLGVDALAHRVLGQVRDLGAKAPKRGLVTYSTRIGTAEQYLVVREELARDGYRRLRLDGALRTIDDVKPSEAAAATDVEVVVDRLGLEVDDEGRTNTRLREALERALASGGAAGEAREARVVVGETADALRIPVRAGLACPKCARAFEPPRPSIFSYNNPEGACPACRGFGRTIGIDWAKVIPDDGKSLNEGAIRAWTGKSAEWERGALVKLCKRHKIPMDLPWKKLTNTARKLVIEGEGGAWEDGKFPGVRGWFKWLETRTYKMHVRVFLARYRAYDTCAACDGGRLSAESRRYRIGGLDLPAFHRLSIAEGLARLDALQCHDGGGARACEALRARFSYLADVGLGHLTLDRSARTLSGGEAQRVGLTAALGTALVGALFVVDEPTVGLHASDVPPLVVALRKLAAAGNAVVVIEHDPIVIAACDRVVEFGPGAGPAGGRVLFDGPPAALAKRRDLPSGPALAGDRTGLPASRRRTPRGALVVRGARAHNLAGEDVSFPLGVLCAVTGPSGSGKSTLTADVLARAAARATGELNADLPLEHEGIDGLGAITLVVHVDQAPLGRTSRGNAATYTKAWDSVRELFAKEGARKDGGAVPPASHFSFNTDGGRCEACSGEGFETVEMQFLADVSIRCPVCKGRRFKDDVLAVELGGKSIADLLETTVDEALAFARALDAPALPGAGGEEKRYSPHYAKLERALAPVARVGLGYLPLGQPLSTLSGGEAQRLKLARALVEVASAKPAEAQGVLVIVDEPSAGLHQVDVARVVEALQALVDGGASVIAVEHDLDLVAASDHVIDLGPGAGIEGGRVVAIGAPDAIAKSDTRTGRALAAHLGATNAFGDRAPTLAAVARAGADGGEAGALDAITVKHAKEHNLHDVSLAIPRGKLVVVTGPSGSGKSTLAFDVVYAEGQRRFLETLSPYARQFLPTLPRPDVESVLGVPPSIALEQRTTRGGRTSTVATVTEVAHYLRLLYAKVGTPHCPKCDEPIVASAPDQIAARVAALAGNAKTITLYAPAIKARKGTHLDVFTLAARAGYTHARVATASEPAVEVAIDPPPMLARNREHTIELIAATSAAEATPARIADALARGGGELRVAITANKKGAKPSELVFSSRRACPSCGVGVPELDPRWFSFNTAQGRCEVCEGAGSTFDEETGLPIAACRACEGTRLGPIPRRVQLDGETYPALTARSVDDALARIATMTAALKKDEIAWQIGEASLSELRRRLEFLARVGLHYLALDRAANTLSGGEMQRLRLAAQLGSGLTGALYVLDEPTIGLHPRDTQRLIGNLRDLVATGSSVMVVEHDADVIRAADWLVDLGPGGGREGGRVIAAGEPAEVLAHPESPTARALGQHVPAPTPRDVTEGSDTKWLELRGARGHNLRGVDLRVPLGRLTVVAGVSGSGKSTLVRQVLYPALRRALKLESPAPLPFDALVGHKHVVRALAVDQSPIGRTPRSVPATFLGIFDPIRKLFAAAPEAQVRGYGPTRFSFNSAQGGRCAACEGGGVVVSEMSFLPDVSSPCEACNGLRYEPGTLEVKYLGRSIGEVLATTAHDAAELFAAHPKIARPLRILDDLGVGYLALGQGSNTLSGGEAQRLKLAAELGETYRHQPTLYVLDEPTTGLHLSDVRKLLGVLRRLVERGDSLVVIEHHPEVIAGADWVVELGPEGGSAGGRVIAEGSPLLVAKKKTPTGLVLRETLAR